MKADYDVLIAGGGMAGLLTAIAVAKFSDQNLRVLVVDRNPREEAGKKTLTGWTCGDAVSKRSVDYAERSLDIRFDKPEVEHAVRGVMVYSPDHQTSVLFEGEGYVLNRKLFPQKQLFYAEKLGVEFQFQVELKRLLAEDGFVVGVEGISLKDKAVFRKTAKVVVDATGSASALRVGLPINGYIEREIDKENDLEVTGRYILTFDRAAEDPTYFDPDYCLIHLDQYLAPGGYCLVADTPVICRNSVKPIQEVKVGDEVLTSVGWMPVSAVTSRSYSGEVVSVTPFMLNLPIKLTPEHLVRVWSPQSGEVWKRADQLVKGKRGSRGNGDRLVVPLPEKGDKPLSTIDIREYVDGEVCGDYVYLPVRRALFNGRLKDGSYARKYVRARPPKRVRLPVNLPLSDEFLELCGWYLSEGCIRGGHVVISNTDEACVKRIKALILRLGLNFLTWLSRKEGREKPRINVEITNSLLGSLFEKLFNRGAENKRLPPWVHGLSRRAKLALLRGMFLGDGCVFKGKAERPDKRAYTTRSYQLALDLWFLLAGIGVVGSMKPNRKRGTWSVMVSGHQADFLNERLTKTRRKKHAGFALGEGVVYLGIRRVERERYSGLVYDLNSGGDFTPLFNVHNCWVFPKGENKVNIGLGVQQRSLHRRNQRFGRNDTLQTLIDQYVKANPAIANPRLADGDNDAGNAKSYWQVPVRRQNDCLVANGYAIIGDAAWMPRPLDAGGIGPIMYAGVIAGRNIAMAVESGDVSERGLWGYNVEYMRQYGSEMASFEVLRRLLQTLDNREINFGMRHILSKEDVERIERREHPEFSNAEKLGIVLKALASPLRAHLRLRVARNLAFTYKKSLFFRSFYKSYPASPEGFPAWRGRLLAELKEAYERFE